MLRLKVELEHCVQAMKDSEVGAEADSREEQYEEAAEEERERERRAVEERELLTELAMTRMTEHMRRLEEENREARDRIRQMEESGTAGSGGGASQPVPRPR